MELFTTQLTRSAAQEQFIQEIVVISVIVAMERHVLIMYASQHRRGMFSLNVTGALGQGLVLLLLEVVRTPLAGTRALVAHPVGRYSAAGLVAG